MMQRAFAILAIIVIASQAFAQGTIELRPLAQLPPGSPVRLGQIATLTGPDAQALQDLVVLDESRWPSNATQASVDLALLRHLITTTTKANMGRLSFTGSSCRLVPPRTVVTPEPKIKPGKSLSGSSNTASVRSLVAERLVEALNVNPDDLHLNFDARDDAILDTDTTGLMAVLAPTGTGDTMPLRLRLYRGDEVLHDGSIRVGVTIRRQALLAQSAIPRGTAISAGMFKSTERWLPPSITVARIEDAQSSVARQRIAVGEILRADHIQAPIIVRKGDLVSVDVLSGFVRIQQQMRTLDEGRAGDTVRMQIAGSKGTLLARLNGPGRAVAILKYSSPINGDE